MTAELIARIEAATEGSQELDIDIGYATGRIAKEIWREHLNADLVDPFTRSVDAALTLVPEGWSHGYRLTTANDDLGSLVEAWVRTKGRMWHGVTHSTPALALCAAALRARFEKEGS